MARLLSVWFGYRQLCRANAGTWDLINGGPATVLFRMLFEDRLHPSQRRQRRWKRHRRLAGPTRPANGRPRSGSTALKNSSLPRVADSMARRKRSAQTAIRSWAEVTTLARQRLGSGVRNRAFSRSGTPGASSIVHWMSATTAKSRSALPAGAAVRRVPVLWRDGRGPILLDQVH